MNQIIQNLKGLNGEAFKYIFRHYREKKGDETKTVKSNRTDNSILPKLALRYTPRNGDTRRTHVRWRSSRNRLILAQE